MKWVVRERRSRSGVLTDCFVEAPQTEGMAYGLEVLGDDYTGYGDVEGKLAHCKLIVERVNGWVATRERKPDAGRMIVKRWKNGSVWAGVYSGSDKDSSFDEWCYLP